MTNQDNTHDVDIWTSWNQNNQARIKIKVLKNLFKLF